MQVATARRFLLFSSILRACNVCCKHQTGDCKERIEKFNITHLHHLRSCTLLRRKTTRRPYLPTRIIITQNTGKYNQYRPSPIAFTTSYGAFFQLRVHEKRPRRISPSRSFTMRFRLAVFAKIAMDGCALGQTDYSHSRFGFEIIVFCVLF